MRALQGGLVKGNLFNGKRQRRRREVSRHVRYSCPPAKIFRKPCRCRLARPAATRVYGSPSSVRRCLRGVPLCLGLWRRISFLPRPRGALRALRFSTLSPTSLPPPTSFCYLHSLVYQRHPAQHYPDRACRQDLSPAPLRGAYSASHPPRAAQSTLPTTTTSTSNSVV